MDLLKELSKISKQKILVVGDIGLDEYVNGNVKRISPEAPVPVVEVDSEEIRLGLASFVAQNISTLGGIPLLVSVVGQDSTAETLRGVLKENGISDKYLIEDSSRPTTKKIRVLSGHHHVVRIDYEKRRFLDAKIQTKLVQTVSDLAKEAHGIILQDYAKGVLSESCVQEIVQIAKKNKLFVIADPHRTTPVNYYKGVDFMTPNTEEAIILSKLMVDDLRGVSENMSEVGDVLMKHIGSTKMVITRGKEGMTLFDSGKTVNIPTFAKEVYDVTGAGDTVVATLAMAHAAGIPLKESCYLANHAAGIVVAKIGCVPCTRSELEKSLV